MSLKSALFGFGLSTKQPGKTGRQAKPVEKRAPRPKNTPKQLPPFNVVLLNDNEHTYEYVIQLLRTVFAYSTDKGYQLARQVDEQNRAIVLTTHRELAELKREQIQSFGVDHRISSCKGSMSAIIEPAQS